MSIIYYVLYCIIVVSSHRALLVGEPAGEGLDDHAAECPDVHLGAQARALNSNNTTNNVNDKDTKIKLYII